MRKAFRRAGWSLLAAGGFGWTGLAAAQGPQSLPNGRTGYVVHTTVSREQTPTLTEAAARHEEIKVELAWLGDGATFPYALVAKVEGSALTVRGYVPNAAVRDIALKIAEKNTSLSVMDGTNVMPTLAIRQTGVPVEQIVQACRDVLAEEFGDKAAEFSLQARSSGQVTVGGTVASHEEKLIISRCLRKANGCMGVINQVAVKPVAQGTKAVVKVTRDGSLVLPAPAAPLTVTTSIRSETKPVPVAGPATVVKETKPLLPPPAKIVTEKAPPVPAKAPVAKETTPVAGTPGFLIMDAEPLGPPAQSHVVKESKPVATARPPKVDIPLPPPVPVPVASTKMTEVKPAPEWVAPERKDTPPALPTFEVPRKLPGALSPEAAPQPELPVPPPIPAAVTTEKKKEPGDPYLATGMMVIDPDKAAPRPAPRTPLAPRSDIVTPSPKVSTPPAAKPTVPGPTSARTTPPRTPVKAMAPVRPELVKTMLPAPEPGKVPVKAPELVKVTEPVQIPEPVRMPAKASEPVKPTVPEPTPPPVLSIALVKKSVETMCGPAARDVSVRMQPDNGVEISLKVNTAEEGHALSTKILGLTELVPFKVSLNMEVAP